MPRIPSIGAARACAIVALCFAHLPGAASAGAQAKAVLRTPVAPPPAVPAPGAASAKPAMPRAPLSGTISEQAGRAVGPPSTPASGSANGIRTRPIRSRPLGPSVYIPLGVRDAPAYQRGSSTLAVVPVSPPVVSEPQFYPTAAPPVWRVVKEENPAQAWRLVDVDDVICFPSGSCRAVTTRVVARWIPTLRAYGFRDRLGRLWQVE